MNPSIDTDRLMAEIDALALLSEVPPPAVTRLVFSPEDQKARAMLADLFAAAGLAVRTDAVGNTFARWQGSNPARKPVATGSHIDAIPNAGKFDGVVGVLGALEAIRALQQAGHQPAAPIDIILFTSEEPTRFGLGCLGSRLLSGRLSPSDAAALRDPSGASLDDLRDAAGFGRAPLSDVALPADAYDAFVELHIEQGPILERENLDIGIVEKIAAPAALRVHLEGDGGHAGAVLMPDRRDASLGAAEIALAVEHLVKSLGSPDGVGTTGVFTIHPGAINSVPCEATLEIDLRDTDFEARQKVEKSLRKEIAAISSRRRLKATTTTINSDPPAICDPRLLDAATHAATASGASHRRLVSRAYHDSLFMALVAPVAMIFIPCRNGWSHRPDEFSSPSQISLGVQTLARTLATLST
jgi:ureidoglycolate amidohydrolase